MHISFPSNIKTVHAEDGSGVGSAIIAGQFLHSTFSITVLMFLVVVVSYD